MAQLIVPIEKSKEIKGPWFIGKDELEELSPIIERINTKLHSSLEEEIRIVASKKFENEKRKSLDEYLKETQADYDYKNTKSEVTIYSKDGKHLIDNSIIGLLKDQNLHGFLSKSLYLNLEHGRHNSFSLEINTYWTHGGLKFEIKCANEETLKDIRYEIGSWIEKHEPNKAKQIWSDNYFSFILFGAFIMMFSFLASFTHFDADYKDIYKKEINKLIESGVTKENQDKATELILKYISDYKPKSSESEIYIVNKIPFQIFLISTFIVLVSIFRPKTIIGLGKRKSRLEFYKVYTKLVLIILPTTFILMPLVDWMKEHFFR